MRPKSKERRRPAVQPRMISRIDPLTPRAVAALINVNFPPRFEPRGIIWTRVSVRRYDGKVVPALDPMKRKIYFFTVTPIEATEEGTDRWAVDRGYISFTPLRLDLTDEQQLARAHLGEPVKKQGAGTG